MFKSNATYWDHMHTLNTNESNLYPNLSLLKWTEIASYFLSTDVT